MTYKAPFVTGTLFEGIVDSIVEDAVALGYSCVESRYTTGELTYAVIKNPASLNYFQSDWHMALGYVTSNKAFGRVHLFEGWDTTSKMATAYAPGSIGSSAPTNSGTINAGPSDLSSMFVVSANSRPMFFITSQNSGVLNGQRYYYSIDEDRLVLSTATSLTGMCAYIGAYERFLPSSDDPVPICLSRWTGTTSFSATRTINANSSVGAATREPRQSVGNDENFAVGNPVGNNDPSWLAWTPAGMGFALSVPTQNDLYSGLPIVSRVPVFGRDDGCRGLFKGLYVVSAVGVTPAGTEARWAFAGNTYTATKMLGLNDDLVSAIYMEQR